MTKPIAILYEHPEWFKPLFAALERRDAAYVHLDATRLSWDPGERESPYSLVVNRMSPSAWARGNADTIWASLHYLEHLERIGTAVLNGADAFRLELSKAAQLDLFQSLGVRYPRARVVNHPDQLEAAAGELAFPVVVKPNIGGSGAGIVEYDTMDALVADADAGAINLGIDGTVLVQERLPARGEAIVRIEVVGGEFLYAIRLDLEPGTFNLCPADYCRIGPEEPSTPGMADGVSGRGLPIAAFEPPAEIIATAERIIAASGADVGGVEYLVSDHDGEPYFYDVNVLSNFVADGEEILGFDPYEQLADFILQRDASPLMALGLSG